MGHPQSKEEGHVQGGYVCGIAGKIFFSSPPETALVKQMTDAIAHRGPDAFGVHQSGVAVLGHRRLAIIDLTDAGRQPMRDTSGRYWITFNGEIYNFKELRAELEKAGARFATHTDTEVILEGYRVWGESVVTRLNGMFAFSLWDSKEESLFVARDRLGKKPLYYSSLPNGDFVFGSELRAVECDPSLSSQPINTHALLGYLRLSYVLGTQSISNGILRLPAAHTLTVTRSGVSKPRKYWDLAHSFSSKRSFSSEAAAGDELRSLLDDAVALRLMSDVPLGAFLSGGVDSSAIVAAMCRTQDAKQTLTFTASFDDSSFNELPEARRVADFLKVSHREQPVHADIVSILPMILSAADEPFADTSLVPLYLLSKFTRKHVTVALSGDGADEIFAGYETYIADKMHQWLRLMPPGWSRLASRAYTSLAPRDFGKVSTDYKIIHFLKQVEHSFARAHYGWREIFSDEELSQLLKPQWKGVIEESHPSQEFERYDHEVKGCHYIDRAMYVDIKTWLVDDILVKADRMTMAHALEARAPFLDYRVVEFAASLPVEMKLAGTKKKYLLKKSQEARLPSETLRRKKAGFNAPVAQWLLGPLKELVTSISTEGPLLDYIEQKPLKALIDRHISRKEDASFKLFSLLCLHQWMSRAERQSTVHLDAASW